MTRSRWMMQSILSGSPVRFCSISHHSQPTSSMRLHLHPAGDQRKCRRQTREARAHQRAMARPTTTRRSNFQMGALHMMMMASRFASPTRTTSASSKVRLESAVPEGTISVTRRGAIGPSRTIFAPIRTDIRTMQQWSHSAHPHFLLNFLQGEGLCQKRPVKLGCELLALTMKWCNRCHP